MPTTLVIGFDSAWSGNNSGAIVGVLKQEDASCAPLGNPLNVNFDQATQQINDWKKVYRPNPYMDAHFFAKLSIDDFESG